MFTKKEVTTMTVDGFVIENGVAVGYEYCTDFGVSVSFPRKCGSLVKICSAETGRFGRYPLCGM